MRILFTIAATAVLLAPAAFAQADPLVEEGYIKAFDGQTLEGWDGDERFWSVVDGAIRGQTTAETPAPHNTFLLWEGGPMEDFILRIKFRIESGNSGIQYRSKHVGDYRVTGYQAEIRDEPGWVGYLYHEMGRGRLVYVGEFSVIDEEGNVEVVGGVSDTEQIVEEGYYRSGEWNEYVIIAQGDYIRHYINGYPTIAVIDRDRVTDPTDPADREGSAREGILALQIHQGDPMIVEFKDIYVKPLESDYGGAELLVHGSLDGWVPNAPDVIDGWAVENGVVTDRGTPIGYIRTEAEYTNYALSLQLRHVEPGNSGVLTRIIGEDEVWPRSIECQGQSGHMGDIWNIGEFPMTVDPDRTEGRRTVKLHDTNEGPIGTWNDYHIILDGGDLTIYVNNLLQNYATECAELPGHIGLQAEGSAKEFRNIVLVPIGEDGGGAE
jgi:hypothetical protein